MLGGVSLLGVQFAVQGVVKEHARGKCPSQGYGLPSRGWSRRMLGESVPPGGTVCRPGGG